MRTDVATVLGTATIAECRHEFGIGSRQAVFAVSGGGEYCGVVMLPELFSGELDGIADEIQVIELARYTNIVLLPDMNVKSAMKIFDAAEAELLAVAENAGSRKIVGFLTESYARRRYVEELDQVMRGNLGSI